MRNIFKSNYEFIALGRIGLLIAGLVAGNFLVITAIVLAGLVLIAWRAPGFISAVKPYDQVKYYFLCVILGGIVLVFRIYFESSIYVLLLIIPFAIYIHFWLLKRTEGLVGVKEYNLYLHNKESNKEKD